MTTDLSERPVRKVHVHDASAKVLLNASDFPSGAYICNLVDGWQITAFDRIAFTGN